jgi:hypothetical protein
MHMDKLYEQNNNIDHSKDAGRGNDGRSSQHQHLFGRRRASDGDQCPSDPTSGFIDK